MAADNNEAEHEYAVPSELGKTTEEEKKAFGNSQENHAVTSL